MAYRMKLSFALAILVSLLFLLPVLFSGTEPPLSSRMEEGSMQPRTPVLVELFTSEGCSSCPPADRLLSDLARSQPVRGAEIIVLSQHVDYWNDIGWADPFSSPQFTQRQNEYAHSLANGRIYTPQMVVDGQQEFVGSQKGKALAAIELATRNSKGQVRISQVTPTSGGAAGAANLQINVSDLPKLAPGEGGDVWLALTENNLQTKVLRGENAGQELSHDGVVRVLKRIGTVSASIPTFSGHQALRLKEAWRREALRVVVFVQLHQGRRVLAASSVPLS
jgi:hypothetical protein